MDNRTGVKKVIKELIQKVVRIRSNNGNIVIQNGNIVGGDLISGDRIMQQGYNYEVIVEGNVLNLDTQGRVTVNGTVGKVDTQGRVEVKGDVKGNVKTMGRVDVEGSVGGDIDTMGKVVIMNNKAEKPERKQTIY